jgi:hypothetical protein
MPLAWLILKNEGRNGQNIGADDDASHKAVRRVAQGGQNLKWLPCESSSRRSNLLVAVSWGSI